MAIKSSIFVLAAAAAIISGCESKAGTGALVGAGVGAGAGAIIGGGRGAVIGGAAGAIGGAVIGAIIDESDRNNLEKQNPRTLNRVDRGEQLSINDVIAMHKSDISDDKIIDLIEKTGSRYRLNSYQIDRLEKAGVSHRVIDYMSNT